MRPLGFQASGGNVLALGPVVDRTDGLAGGFGEGGRFGFLLLAMGVSRV